MKRSFLWIVLGIVSAVSGIAVAAPFLGREGNPVNARSVLDFTMRSIEGKDTPLSSFRGKALLIVNVASQCGYTPQYEGLQALFTKYRDRGLVVLGFPANNFGAQEPGTDAEIKTFCTTRFNVTFPMFAKISVKGGDIHPLYRFLTGKDSNPDFGGDVSWNFNKFLVDKNGRIVARFESKVAPDNPRLIEAVESTLK